MQIAYILDIYPTMVLYVLTCHHPTLNQDMKGRLQTVYEERNKEDLEKRLKRIEGQVRGIYRMIDEERYCIDILNQIIAARAALSKVGMALLKSHMRGCVISAIREEHHEQAIEELMDVLTKFAK